MTFNFTSSYNIGDQIYSTASDAAIPDFGQVLLSSVTLRTPLYCPSSDTGLPSWQLPTLSSGETSSEGVSVFQQGGSVGLALRSTAPVGVYSCVANNGEVLASVHVTDSELLIIC